MVLQGQPCGRVGRCRGFEGPLDESGPSAFSARYSPTPWNRRGAVTVTNFQSQPARAAHRQVLLAEVQRLEVAELRNERDHQVQIVIAEIAVAEIDERELREQRRRGECHEDVDRPRGPQEAELGQRGKCRWRCGLGDQAGGLERGARELLELRPWRAERPRERRAELERAELGQWCLEPRRAVIDHELAQVREAGAW